MTRAWPVPTSPNTLLFVGDIHWGGINVARAARVSQDMAALNNPTVAAIVAIGDSTHNGTSEEDAATAAFLATFGDEDVYTACGNHDIWGNARTPAQWAAAWGVPSKNYTVDLGFAMLIFVGPDQLTGDNTTIILTQATLDWLDAQLAAAGSKRCIVVCHAPLYGTVLGDSTSYTSMDGPFHVQAPTAGGQSAAIYAVLAAHTNAVAWISGHTHSPPTSPRLVCGVDLGEHTLAAINCSALYYVGKSAELTDPLYSQWVTLLDDRIEVRYRNHAAAQWVSPNSRGVATVML